MLIPLQQKPLILKHLANHADTDVLEAVSGNINTPGETLRKLASEGKGRTKSFIVCNPNTPADVLEYLSKNEDELIRFSVAENPNTPQNVLSQLAKDTNERTAQTAKQMIGERKEEYGFVTVYGGKGISSALARHFKACGINGKKVLNPRITPKGLKKLVKKDPISVAKHKNTPPEVLLKLSQSDDVSIRQAVAINPNLPTNILKKLANDDSYQVRRKVAENPNTPLNILFQKLARDTKVISAIACQMSSNHSGIYHEAENIIDILGEYCGTPVETIVQALISKGSYRARLFLASRSDLPVGLFTHLAESNESRVRETIAQNPNLPVSLLEKLAKDKNSKVRMYVAAKINLSPQILEELAKDKAFEVRQKVYHNPSLPKEVVARILCSEYASLYLKLNPNYLSNHPDIKALVIHHYLNVESHFMWVNNPYDKYSSMWINYIILTQPEISQELLQAKSNSVFWVKRLAVVQNPQTPQSTLEKLAKDSNQLVRAAALDTLQHLLSSV